MEWILVTSRASSKERGGRMLTIRFASIVYPEPGGLTRRSLALSGHPDARRAVRLRPPPLFPAAAQHVRGGWGLPRSGKARGGTGNSLPSIRRAA
jgi:hypothetical protein